MSSSRTQGSFNLSFQPTQKPVGRTRVAFCVRDPQNHYFLELGPKASYLGRTEAGVERALVFLDAGLDKLMDRRVVIERRSLRIGVAVDGRMVAAVDDGVFEGGGVAFGGRKSGLKLSAFRVRRVGEIYFADDFMRIPEEAGHWRTVTGKWQIKILKNPGRSINAFNYLGTGKPGAAVTGQGNWSDVEFSAACRPRGSAVVGMYVAYRGPQNYYLFRWYSRSSKTPIRQFVRCREGREEVLAQSKGGHLGDQWYRLAAWYGGGQAQVWIDDTAVFRVADSGLTMGRVGMYVESEVGVEFDDVLVQSRPSFADDFNAATGTRWTAQGGRWRYLSQGASWFPTPSPQRRLFVAAPGSALYVAGDPRWRDYELSADVGPWDRGSLGLAFALADGSDYYSAEWGENALQICKTVAGRRTVLASREMAKPAKSARMAVRADHGRLRVLVDGESVLDARDHELGPGQVALLARDTEVGLFDNVAIRLLPPMEPLLSVHEVFSGEISMGTWSDALRDWRVEPIAGSPAGSAPSTDKMSAGIRDAACWHHAAVPGDADLDLKLTTALEEKARVSLLVAGDGKETSSCYELAVRRAGKKDAAKGCALELLRKGKSVAESLVPWGPGPHNVGLSRSGTLLIAKVGGRIAASWRDPEPLKGDRVGFTTRGHALNVTDFNIYSRNVLSYTFRTAPTEWRVGGGKWEISNRWQCDPRWSFFSGRGDGNVVLWNKRRFLGDFTLEFYAGIKMDRDRGSRYEYASDINATVCGDGKNLTSGYSFVFGGNNNSVTRIYRGTTVLAETTGTLIQSRGHHRKWYYIRVAKRGRSLEMKIDDQVVLAVEDPQPHPGGYMSIWSHDNGVMVARVRVSAEEITPCESPDVVVPDTCRSVYDPTPKKQPGTVAALR